MQKLKQSVKNLGEHLRLSGVDHRDALRKKLEAAHPSPIVVRKPFSWMLVYAFGAMAVVVFIVVSNTSPRYPAYDEVLLADAVSDEEIFRMDTATVDSTVFAFTGPSQVGAVEKMVAYDGDDIGQSVTRYVFAPSEDIVDYEKENGAMLEQTISVSLLTEEDDVADRIASLIASLGGHLESIQINDDRFAEVSGSIPVESMSTFYESLHGLVKNSAFIEKYLQGDSVTSEALNIDARLETLHETETSLTEQMNKETDPTQKKKLQDRLERISDDIASLVNDQSVLRDRVTYVSVSVNIEHVPSFWEAESQHDIRQMIAGYDTPSMGERVLINIVSWFLGVLVFVSKTFWLLIPGGIIGVIIYRKKKVLREME